MSEPTTATAAFQIASWEENAYQELAGTEKLTRTVVRQTYTGDFTGESRSDSLMYYPTNDQPVHYVGLERLSGTLAGRTGNFVVQAHGAYADGVAETNWFVVPGSGSDELAGLRGEGGYRAKSGESAVQVTFAYHFVD